MREGGREAGRQPCEEPCEWKGKKSGQRLQGEGLERSRVCSVHEETGQGVRLRNSLQWLSQRHVDHHVLSPLPPSLPPYALLSALPPLPPPCFVSVYHILSAHPNYFLSFSLIIIFSSYTQALLSVCLGHARSTDWTSRTRSAAVPAYRCVGSHCCTLLVERKFRGKDVNRKYSFFIVRMYLNTTFEKICIKWHNTHLFEFDLTLCFLKDKAQQIA